MKILLSFTLIFGFAAVGFGQSTGAPSSEKPVVLSVVKPAETGENPEAAKARNRGIDLMMKGDHKLSIVEFSKAIEIDPNFADAYNRRGAAYSNLKNNKQAIPDFTKAIELNPKSIVPYMNRAGSYMIEKNYKSAADDYSKLIELSPALAALYYDLRADVYDAMKRKDLASADRKKAKELRNK